MRSTCGEIFSSITLSILTVVFLIGGLSIKSIELSSAQTQDPTHKTVWDGVYTNSQANRGKSGYATNCASCHAADLTGDLAQPLVGEVFWKFSEADTMHGLFSRIRSSMPRSNPSSLHDESYLDIIAYILQVNGFPPGNKELHSDIDTLQNILIERKLGPDGKPPEAPNFSLVQVIGCLIHESKDSWVLTSSTRPTVTRDLKLTTEELNAIQNTPLGNQTYELMDANFYEPEIYEGRKIKAVGLLIKSPDTQKINVTSLQMIAINCEN